MPAYSSPCAVRAARRSLSVLLIRLCDPSMYGSSGPFKTAGEFRQQSTALPWQEGPTPACDMLEAANR
jgi:hypothetical protein